MTLVHELFDTPRMFVYRVLTNAPGWQAGVAPMCRYRVPMQLPQNTCLSCYSDAVRPGAFAECEWHFVI